MLFPNDENLQSSTTGFERTSNHKFKDASARFTVGAGIDYQKQFAHIYSKRLNEMRPLLAEKATEKWGEKYEVKKLTDLREDNPEKCIIIGTTFVHQKLKPSILKEISEETQMTPQPIRNNFADDSDILVLEDEVQRIQLLGEINVHNFVTGIVTAVLGYENDEGKFVVEEYIFYECGPQKPLKELTTSPIVVFISGLDQSSEHDFSFSLQLFEQWLFGNMPNTNNDHDIEASNVVRVIVAGNSIRTSMEVRLKSILVRQPESLVTLQAVKSVDDLLANWSQSVNVDLMPGEFDPSNFMFPQQPMHQCMFPNSAQNSSFKCVTNPYEFYIEDRLILGTSGQNITNIQKFSRIDDTLNALKLVAEWSNIAPTAPDSLPCYPYYEADPFIIKNCPHLLFAGNANEYQTSIYTKSNGEKVRLLCIPSFSKTESVVAVNLRTMECKQLCFKINEFDEIDK